MNDMWTSVVRTVVPMIAGLLVSLALKIGYDLDDATATQAAAFGVATLWYVAARLVERRWPKFGWLLGTPSQPTYG